MSLLIFGTTSFDTIETPSGTATRVLGGSAMHACHAASRFCPVRVVSAVGYDFPDFWREEIARRHIDIEGLRSVPNVKTQYWRGRHSANLHDREHLEVDLDIFDHFNPIPPTSYQDSNYVLLAQHDPVFQLRCLDHLRPKWVMADTIDYWILNRRSKLGELLRRIDGLLVNDHEARLLSEELDLVRAGKRLLDLGPSVVIVKKGEHGVILFTREDIFVLPAYPTGDTIDPTGAGDAFAGGMMGYLAQIEGQPMEHLRQAVVEGTLIASFIVEGYGLSAIQHLRSNEYEERRQRFDRFTRR